MNIKIPNNKRVWVTSDLHFGHNNIIKYCDRPFQNVLQMDTTLIDNWNNLVTDDDIVINAGDFAFCNDKRVIEILSSLNGTQYFVYGNHDRVMKRDSVQLFCEKTKKIEVFCDNLEFRYEGFLVFVSHYAHRVWNQMHRGSIHLYGHSHGTLPGEGRSIDIGVDSNETKTKYYPLLLTDILEQLKER